MARYSDRVLLPVEVVILSRYQQAVSGRVLELGCGGGRLLGYLAEISRDAQGIDLSKAMVERCNRAYPKARARVGDIGNLQDVKELAFDAVFAIDNVLDVFDHSERRRVLAEIRGLIDPQGVFIFSTHNLASLDGDGSASRAISRSRQAVAVLSKLERLPVGEVVRSAPRLPARLRNRRRLGPLQYRESDHAVINDQAHDYSLLHYYIGRDDQERQLAEIGYELLECLDVDGRPVGAGQACRDPWLHYIVGPAR